MTEDYSRDARRHTSSGLEAATRASDPRGVALLRAAVANMVDAVITIDAAGTIQWVNRATQVMFGYGEGELVGRRVNILMPGPHRYQHDVYIQRYLDTGQPRVIGIGREVEARRADGTTFPVEIAISEVVLDDGHWFTGVIRDVSDRARAEKAESRLRDMQLQHTQYERVAVAGEMAAMVAHEVRTPLNALSINVQLVERLLRREDADRERAQELLGRLKGEVERINTLLADYLKMFRAEARHDDSEQFDADEVVLEAVEFISHQAHTQGVKVHRELDTNGAAVAGHGASFRQVMLNLVLNALQVLPDGGEIAVESRVEGSCVIIIVRDSGPGIAESDLGRIFKPFVTDKASGTGLGLAITDRIIRRLGGSISASNSADGSGAQFRIALPLASTSGTC